MDPKVHAVYRATRVKCFVSVANILWNCFSLIMINSLEAARNKATALLRAQLWLQMWPGAQKIYMVKFLMMAEVLKVSVRTWLGAGVRVSFVSGWIDWVNWCQLENNPSCDWLQAEAHEFSASVNTDVRKRKKKRWQQQPQFYFWNSKMGVMAQLVQRWLKYF